MLMAGADDVAPRLIGFRLVRVVGGLVLSGEIVETEAYLGARDRASHARGGRRTPRNESMYARAGTAYVYFTYGMHHCFNVVCAGEGDPQAVLVRALAPLTGLDAMREARGGVSAARDLCSGPGKLCQALQINRTLDGCDLCMPGPLYLAGPEPGATAPRVRRDRRVGLGDVGAWGTRRLRWFVTGSPWVSVKGAGETGKPGGPARRNKRA